MNLKKYSLILASKSPRRKELLEFLGIPFETIPSNIDEIGDETNPFELALSIAKDKGVFVYKKLESRPHFGKTFFPLVIGCDTIVVLEKKVYGKPKDGQDAGRMLQELSGKTHQVITGVHLGRFDFNLGQYLSKDFYVSSKVKFDIISKDILDNYLCTEDSLDKAGAYGIQGPSLTFISNLEGSYSNVVGFPLSDFVRELKDFLGYPEDQDGKWRGLFLIP
jgi:septum formation protein